MNLARGAAVEHLTATDSGVEQSWTFSTRPGARGPLTVDVTVDGLPYRNTSAMGLHFGDGNTRLRYGHATWIDAHGLRTSVPARLASGRVRLTVPSRVVDDSAYPATLDPMISPEFGMDDPVTGPSGGSMPAVAGSPGQFFVVWVDGRIGEATDPAAAGSQASVFGARVTDDGHVLDPVGILISTTRSDQFAPAVTRNGTDYVVAWLAATSGPFDGDIYACRVGTDGTDFLVGWWNSDSLYGSVFAARVAADGPVLDVPPLAITPCSNDEADVTATFDGTRYVLAWQHGLSPFGESGASLLGVGVTPAGALLDLPGFTLAADPFYDAQPALSSDGAGHSVVIYDRPDLALPYGSVRVRARSITFGPEDDDAGIVTVVCDGGALDAATDAVGADGASDAAVTDGGTDAARTVVDAGAMPGGALRDGCACTLVTGQDAQGDRPLGMLAAFALVASCRRRARHIAPWKR